MPSVSDKKCGIEWCERKAAVHGQYCPAHYQERLKYGKFLTLAEREERKRINGKARTKQMLKIWSDPAFAAEQRKKRKAAGLAKRKRCSVTGCAQRARAHDLCPKHAWHKKTYGDPLAGPVRPRRGTGTQVSCHGYLQVKVPSHPEADHHGYVMEHRLIMEQHLQRQLNAKEVVHHINGVVTDNRIENLLLFPSQSAHVKHHAQLRRKK
jgi:hypothetical protein